MNIGVIRERGAFDRRVAITPAIVRRLAASDHAVWVESGAGDGAMFPDNDYIRAGARIAYSPAEVIQRADLLPKIGRPTAEELGFCRPHSVVAAFYHMPVADRALLEALEARCLTAIGCEIIQQPDGTLPVLSGISEIAGQMLVPIAAHLLRSSSGGRGILLGGTPGVPPAKMVIIGVGSVGFAAVKSAAAAGAHVTAFDRDPRKLRRVLDHVPGVETCLADEDSIAEAVAAADVVIGAVLVAGTKTPHVVTRAMVDRMKAGAALVDVSIDQGGCIETIRPTSHSDPIFREEGVIHYGVTNMPGAVAQTSTYALTNRTLKYAMLLADNGIEKAVTMDKALYKGVNVYNGKVAYKQVADDLHLPYEAMKA